MLILTHNLLNNATLRNFGPITEIKWGNLAQINLVIGGNGSGKTFLLKALYSAMRTVEEYKRGDDPRTVGEILAEKLYWTFQPEKIGDLVMKGADAPLSCAITLADQPFSFSFGKDTTRQIAMVDNQVPPRQANSIFLPAKEVLSLHHLILKTREQDKLFGFDDTYLDLARALQRPLQRGKNYVEFAQSRQQLEAIIGGRIEYDETAGRWQFKRGNQKFPIGITAEGIKKIAILDTLLGNRYLNTDSVIFIDEPEAALHPEAISQLLDIVAILAESGIQFFMASHSYFVIKKLYLIAQTQGWSIPVLAAHGAGWDYADLQAGMPANAIISESINLYKQEVGLALL